MRPKFRTHWTVVVLAVVAAAHAGCSDEDAPGGGGRDSTTAVGTTAGSGGGSTASAGDGGSGDGGGSGGAGPDAVVQVAIGGFHLCVLFRSGSVRCGSHSAPPLQGNEERLAEEPPLEGTEVDVGGTVTQLAAGWSHTCALLDTGGVRCWGDHVLGYGPGEDAYEDVPPSARGDIDVGGRVTQLAAGWYHTCALLDTGAVRCWGSGQEGVLGHASTEAIGDDEVPSAAGDVDVGGTVVQVTAGAQRTCALLDTGALRCWGDALGLGYPDPEDIGDDELPSSAGDVAVEGRVVQVAMGLWHTCALLHGGAVRCWGGGWNGQLGYGHDGSIDDASEAGDVEVGGVVTQLAAAPYFTCALLETGAVRCWGTGGLWLGYGHEENIGDDEVPASAGDVDIGGTAVQIASGGMINPFGSSLALTCALLESGALRCW